MKEEFLDYVEDIVEAMNDALRFVKGLEYDDFMRDKKTSYAVTRAIEIIGEAVKKDSKHSQETLSKDTLEEDGGHERQIDP